MAQVSCACGCWETEEGHLLLPPQHHCGSQGVSRGQNLPVPAYSHLYFSVSIIPIEGMLLNIERHSKAA